MFINLRGVKESGLVFALPTYFFVAMMYLTVGTGLFRYLTGSLHPVPDPPPLDVETTRAFGLFLLLHAFSSGTTAVTGVEAISNGIPAFKEPRSQQRRGHADVDVGDPRLAVPGHQLPRRPDRGGALGARDGDLPARARGVRGARDAVPGGDRRDHGDPGHGGKHRLRRLPAARGAAGGRRLPPAPAHLPRQPPRLLARHRGARPRRIAPHRGVRGQRHRPDPAVRDRRVPVVHALAGGDGAALAQGGPARGRAGGQGTRLRAASGPALAPEAGHERRGRGHHRGR